MMPELASSQECRPVCTRKPKPSPRGGAGLLAERPHLTWADTDVWNEAWQRGPGGGFRPRASHAAFPHVQTLASLEGHSREGRRLPEREKSRELSALCAASCAGRRQLQSAYVGLLPGF
ncbi:unnamed protein product [Rangifer tarandus platyrhynchus]|uniref:Uncharacterized protein n=2 Tax=Rangifer tarandus platyrhynchus TaxID=3082113 RepID=A0AC59ZMD8_RANTA|nr:unnamed protein product [Rangifer tarandus platyrhynchus]